jgi:hypothetical protein
LVSCVALPHANSAGAALILFRLFHRVPDTAPPIGVDRMLAAVSITGQPAHTPGTRLMYDP